MADDTLIRVISAWQDVLPSVPLGADDDVNEAGANSLHALRVIARLREVDAVALDLRDVFAHPTPRALATLIDERKG